MLFDTRAWSNANIMFRYFSKDWKNAIMELPLPKEATLSEAGSEEKIEVMRARLEHGEHLHHQNDEIRLKSDELCLVSAIKILL